MKLNAKFDGSSQYSINGFGWTQGVNSTGYIDLGYNIPLPGGQFLWSNKGPFSLLHLNGRDQTHTPEEGFRPWMKTGITLTDNADLSYIGLRQVGAIYSIPLKKSSKEISKYSQIRCKLETDRSFIPRSIRPIFIPVSSNSSA